MSPVSACASKCSIDTRPWPRTFATPFASANAMEWSPPSTTGIAPDRVTVSTAASSAGRAVSMSPENISTSPASSDPQVAQAVGAQRQAGPGPVVRQVVGHPDRLRAEPGARPVGGAAVERSPEDDDVRAGEARRIAQVAALDTEEGEVGPVLGAVAGHGGQPLTRSAASAPPTEPVVSRPQPKQVQTAQRAAHSGARNGAQRASAARTPQLSMFAMTCLMRV